MTLNDQIMETLDHVLNKKQPTIKFYPEIIIATSMNINLKRIDFTLSPPSKSTNLFDTNQPIIFKNMCLPVMTLKSKNLMLTNVRYVNCVITMEKYVFQADPDYENYIDYLDVCKNTIIIKRGF